MNRGNDPAADDDPTGEEQALDFDPTATDQLDDTYRMRVVAASENSAGSIDSDDRGQPRRKCITESDTPAQPGVPSLASAGTRGEHRENENGGGSKDPTPASLIAPESV